METAPTPLSPRFTIELEFVLCLSNPQYLQYLAATHPQLLNSPRRSKTSTANSGGVDNDDDDSDAARFARYLEYLYNYWRTPEYSKYLTHPGAVLRNLELLQEEQFRRDIIRPDVISKLFLTGTEDQDQDPNRDRDRDPALSLATVTVNEPPEISEMDKIDE